MGGITFHSRGVERQTEDLDLVSEAWLPLFWNLRKPPNSSKPQLSHTRLRAQHQLMLTHHELSGNGLCPASPGEEKSPSVLQPPNTRLVQAAHEPTHRKTNLGAWPGWAVPLSFYG